MTWISSLKGFGERELFSMESLFKSHPEACLVIVSKSLDSNAGTQILKPFVSNGFKVMAVAPDFGYIFKDTHAETWFNRLKHSEIESWSPTHPRHHPRDQVRTIVPPLVQVWRHLHRLRLLE